ncbi:MAG: TetR/AcrR family transcriptional regulator [Ruminococcaceae bacterium]|nr:TetR/AcrR family transcriptional regulator [Oscillospiraceae bacterium]
MPPRAKFTKDELVCAALDLVRAKGEQALTARALGEMLHSSPRPLFTVFESMEELREEVGRRAYERYLSYLDTDMKSGVYPPYKASGMAYIRFAKEESRLFKMIFLRDRTGKDQSAGPDFAALVDVIMKANHITREQAELLHLEMWTAVHGIATMLATSFLVLEEELISRMLTDIYLGVRTRMAEEKKDGGC